MHLSSGRVVKRAEIVADRAEISHAERHGSEPPAVAGGCTLGSNRESSGRSTARYRRRFRTVCDNRRSVLNAAPSRSLSINNPLNENNRSPRLRYSTNDQTSAPAGRSGLRRNLLRRWFGSGHGQQVSTAAK